MKYLVLTVFIFCTVYVQAQYKTPFFNMLTVENGLPQASISTRLEDKYGYFWLGTSNGLVRYDGYRLKQYPILNEEGLPVNPAPISKLFEDSKGTLWVVVNLQGIYRLDRNRDVFVRVSFGADGDAVLKSSPMNSLHKDKQKNIYWVETFSSEREKNFIYSIDLENKKLQVYDDVAKDNRFIPANYVTSLSINPSGKVWLITDSLLSFFDVPSGSFKPFFSVPKIPGIARFTYSMADPLDPEIIWINTSSLENPRIGVGNETRGMVQLNVVSKTYKTSLPGSKEVGTIPYNCFHAFTDSLKRVWISTEKGISLYDRKKRDFTHYPLQYPNNETHAEKIAADMDGNLWIAGLSGGLFFLDIKAGTSYTYVPDGGSGDLPAYRNVGEVFFDRSGTLWVTIPEEGIAWIDRQKTLFAPAAIYPFKKAVGTRDIPEQYAIVATEGDSICYITDTASMFAWNTITNVFTPIDLKDKKLYKAIINIAKDKDGNLWMACVNYGMLQYDPLSGRINTYRHDPNDNTSLPGIFVIDLAADKDGIIWLATVDKGLNSFNPKTKTFTQYPFAINSGSRQVKDSLDDRTSTCLFIDNDGIIWIGTNSGAVNSYDPRTRKFRSYLNYKEGFFAVNAINEDSRHRLWVSTYLSGLFLLDKKTGALRQYAEKNGLIHNSVFGVQEDAAGNIWAATPKGLSRINPVTHVISNFGAAKPWVWEYFIKNLRDRNGWFNIAGKNGIIRFNPLQLNESSTPPAVYIESVGYRMKDQSNDTLLFPEGLDEIRLKHDENRISFQYIGLHFANAEQNQYAYQLVGYDKDWIQAGTQRSVTYSNLSPNTYTFRVKAANSDGVWNETGAQIILIITPPWWRTWWAYGLYALLVMVAGYLIYKYQQYYIVKRERERTQQKELAQAKEIEKAYTELKATQTQLIQSEKMASLGELTAGIAHEIQNPLNFVNNFSEVSNELIGELVEEVDKGNTDEVKLIAKGIQQNLEKINHHGKRADAIVKGMLQHSRSSSGIKEPTDINALCDEYLRLAYHGLRAKDNAFNASFSTNFDATVGMVNVMPQELGRVLLNLINNAFFAVTEKSKTAGPGYQPAVSVSTSKLDNKVAIAVADNGPGIPDTIKDKIFQPFFTTKPTGQGTGLGLSLSYDIVKAHGGEIQVDSKEGDGTAFTIILPIT